MDKTTEPIVTLKPKFHVAYNLIWSVIFFLPLLGSMNRVINDTIYEYNLLTIYWSGLTLATLWAVVYFYAKYTTIRFYRDYVEFTFTFVCSIRKIVSYKNIRQVDFYRGPIGNLFNLTTVKLLSSATVAQGHSGGINVATCVVTDEDEIKIFEIVSKSSTQSL